MSCPARILAVLEKAGLAKYHSIFTKEEFDYKSFIDVTDSELRELGVTAVGARKRILAAVQEESSSVGLRTQADPWPSPESHATVSADSSGSGDAARLTEQLAGLKTSSDADNVSPEPVASSSA